MAENGWKGLKLAYNGLKWLEVSGMNGNGYKTLEMDGITGMA